MILERIEKVAYRLQLPSDSSVHPVFHVSQLKEAIGNQVTPTPLSTGLIQLELQVECLKGIRYRNNKDIEVLIGWRGLPAFEDSWESYVDMCTQFPAFHLEDEVNQWGGVLISHRFQRCIVEGGNFW